MEPCVFCINKNAYNMFSFVVEELKCAAVARTHPPHTFWALNIMYYDELPTECMECGPAQAQEANINKFALIYLCISSDYIECWLDYRYMSISFMWIFNPPATLGSFWLTGSIRVKFLWGPPDGLWNLSSCLFHKYIRYDITLFLGFGHNVCNSVILLHKMILV